MQRIVALIFVSVLFDFAAPVRGQTTQQDQSLQEQLVPESFKIQANAVAFKINWFWRTAITFTLTNDSGMNLYLGVLHDGITFGDCSSVDDIRGALRFLPERRIPGYESPRATFVPAGARVSGTITMRDCTATSTEPKNYPLSITLLVSKTESSKAMTTFPLSIDAPTRLSQEE